MSLKPVSEQPSLFELVGKIAILDIAPFISVASIVCNVFWFWFLSYRTGFPYFGVITISDYLSVAFTVTAIPVLGATAACLGPWIVICTCFYKLKKNEKILSVKLIGPVVLLSLIITWRYAITDVGILKNENQVYRAYMTNGNFEFFVGLTNGVLVKKHEGRGLIFYPWSKVKSIERE